MSTAHLRGRGEEPATSTAATTGTRNWTANTGVQFQLDENSTGTTLDEWFDGVKLTIW